MVIITLHLRCIRIYVAQTHADDHSISTSPQKIENKQQTELKIHLKRYLAACPHLKNSNFLCFWHSFLGSFIHLVIYLVLVLVINLNLFYAVSHLSQNTFMVIERSFSQFVNCEFQTRPIGTWSTRMRNRVVFTSSTGAQLFWPTVWAKLQVFGASLPACSNGFDPRSELTSHVRLPISIKINQRSHSVFMSLARCNFGRPVN